MIRVVMRFEDSERLNVRHVSLATWFAQLCNLVNAACWKTGKPCLHVRRGDCTTGWNYDGPELICSSLVGHDCRNDWRQHMRNDWRYPKGMVFPPESDLASAVHLSDHIKVIRIQILLDPLFQCLGLAISTTPRALLLHKYSNNSIIA